MTPQLELSPYVGLRPFREADCPFFFGRQRDIRLIASNLLSSPLTVLYGPSGVGKSSVLQAGVAPHLHKESAAGILYFNEWQDASFLSSLKSKWGEGRSLLMLDQFEEYLLYHSNDAAQEEFEGILARVINRDDGVTRILIGIREDALFRLDERMSLRIPNLLENTLQLRHLSRTAAREAIEGPVRVLNERMAVKGDGYSLEPALVEALLDEMESGQRQIETAFLQLVLSQIWTETIREQSRVMSVETLKKLGGALTIVDRHVKHVMDSFSEVQRDVGMRLFDYLVTPSGTKIAQSFVDLVALGGAQEAVVRQFLSALSDRSDSRILRRLSNPERYELFHDVLARPLLDWRRGIIEENKNRELRRRQTVFAEQQRRELAQAQALAEEQARSARRLRGLVAALLVVVLVAIGAAAWAISEKRAATRNAERANSAAQAAESASNRAMIAERNAQARASEAEAARAEASGQKDKARALEADAANYRQQAGELQKKTGDLQKRADSNESAVSSLVILRADLTAARQEVLTEIGLRKKAEGEAKDLQTKLDKAKETIASFQPHVEPPTKEPATAQRRETETGASGRNQLPAINPLAEIQSHVSVTGIFTGADSSAWGSAVGRACFQFLLTIHSITGTTVRVKRVTVHTSGGKHIPSLSPESPTASIRQKDKMTLSEHISYDNDRIYGTSAVNVYVAFFARTDVPEPKAIVEATVTFVTVDGKLEFEKSFKPEIR